jgi:hypothetical protein
VCYTENSYGYAFMVGDEPSLHRVAQGSQTGPRFPETGPPLGDMIVSNLFHGKRHLVSHTQRGVSHTLQRIDALIKTLELQIFRVGIAGPDTRENACVRHSVLHREF